MLRVIMMSVFLLIFSSTVWAEEFELDVVRQGANIFAVTAEDLFIQTEYCFESVTSARAVLRFAETESMLIFTDQKSQCDVRMVYGRSQLEPGDYKVSVTRDDENWYGIVGDEAALKTNGCLSLVEDAEAKLIINADGTGTLSIPSADEECQVEGVYSKAELKAVEG